MYTAAFPMLRKEFVGWSYLMRAFDHSDSPSLTGPPSLGQNPASMHIKSSAFWT